MKKYLRKEVAVWDAWQLYKDFFDASKKIDEALKALEDFQYSKVRQLLKEAQKICDL